jgi:hypothetical protein
MNESVERRNCRGCGKPLLFVKDANGKVHPLDASAPVYMLQADLTGATIAVRTTAYVSHFSTCPKANDFSASNRGRR